MTTYISKADYRRQKTALTRALNSGDPAKVLGTVQKTLDEWAGCAWPDDWHRWRVAAEDALWEAGRRSRTAFDARDFDESDRWHSVAKLLDDVVFNRFQ